MPARRGTPTACANRFIYHLRPPHRGEIVVFTVPPAARAAGCAAGGSTFVKRLIGLPGERVREDGEGFLWINGHKLDEPYVEPTRRAQDRGYRNRTWVVPAHEYFMVGDNRGQSCDSRAWGYVPRANLIGEVFVIYWPPSRTSRKLLLGAGVLVAATAAVALFRRRRRHNPRIAVRPWDRP